MKLISYFKFIPILFIVNVSNIENVFGQQNIDSSSYFAYKAWEIYRDANYVKPDSAQLNKGIEFINKAISLHFYDSSNTYYIRAELYNYLRKRKEAEIDFYKSIYISPCNLGSYERLHQLLWEQQTKINASAKMRELAIKNYYSCIEKDSLNANLWSDLAKIYFLNYYLTKEEYNLVINLYKKAISIDSTNGKIWYDLSYIYGVRKFYMDDPKNLILNEKKCFQNAIKYNDNPEYRKSFAYFYYHLKLFSKGLEIINEGINKFPHDLELLELQKIFRKKVESVKVQKINKRKTTRSSTSSLKN